MQKRAATWKGKKRKPYVNYDEVAPSCRRGEGLAAEIRREMKEKRGNERRQTADKR